MKPQAMPGALHGLEARQTNPWRYRVNVWVVCRISRAWVLGCTPQLRHHSASREKQSIKTCLSAQQVFILPFFHRSFDPASKPLLHYIPGTNVWFLPCVCLHRYRSWGVRTFSLRHFVPSDTAAPTPPARGRYFPSHSLVGTALQQVATSLMLRIHPLSNASPVGANSSTPVGVFYAKLCSLAKLSHAATPHRGNFGLSRHADMTWNATWATRIGSMRVPRQRILKSASATRISLSCACFMAVTNFLTKSCSQRLRRHLSGAPIFDFMAIKETISHMI